jgi:hypothetical protein
MSSLGPISAGVTRRYLQISAVVQYLVAPADIWSCRRYRHILCCAAVARYSIAHLCCCTMAVDVVGAMSTMALLTSHVVEKIPFPSRRAHRLPPPPPFNPNNTPPSARAPLRLATAPLSLEKQQQSTFKVAGGDGEVTEGETIRRRTTDDDNDKKNSTIKSHLPRPDQRLSYHGMPNCRRVEG